MRHVIIGAGAAGMTAAKTIRERRGEDEIVVISLDDAVHSRCMLHKYISGERSAESLDFLPPRFFPDNAVRWLSGKRVTGIDTKQKLVQMSNGLETYDKLLIATGANSFIPPVGHLREAKNVYGLRHLSDAKAIRERALASRSAVVVGSGLVGLDAAYALLEMGMQVAVVEMADRILPLQLDATAAAAYQERFERHGCRFYLQRKASHTVMDDRQEITQVVLDNGEELACDLVIVAAGVRPALEFLEGGAIAVTRGIQVDSHMRTNCEDVYAAGDVAGLSGIWPNAMKQGVVAARNMCGERVEYDDAYATKNTINFFGLTCLSVGSIQPEEGDTVLVREDHARYNKIVLRQGCVQGVLLQGDIGHSGIWQYLVKNKVDVSGLEKPLWKLSFADFYGLGERGQYRWETEQKRA